MKKKYILIVSKLVFGSLGASSIVTEVFVLVGGGTFVPANFFSYFTIESNLIASVMFLTSAVMILLDKQGGRLVDMVRGASALNMIMTGIVFGILLSGYDPAILTAVPWDNTVLHYIIPVAVCIDWFVDSPREVIPFRRAFLWLVFPLLYLAYTLIRGVFVGWYPYPFLNPTDPQGYGGVAVTSVGIAVMAAVITALLIVVVRFIVGVRVSNVNSLS